MLKNNLEIYRLRPDCVKKIQYIEHSHDFANSHLFERVNEIDDTFVNVIVFIDSKPTHYTSIAVIYNGMIQYAGGSGSCFNPLVREYNGEAHMSAPKPFNYMEVARMVLVCKLILLRQVGLIPYSFRIQDSVLYQSGMYGVLFTLLDLIGLGKVQAGDVLFDTTPQRKLLSA